MVVKPIFGSRGQGATRVVDADIADTIFKAITFHHGVIYMQEFVPTDTQTYEHSSSATELSHSMRRVAKGWKTNYSQGAKPAPAKISKEFEELAIKSAKAVGCKIAGVDILEGPEWTTHR